MKTPTEIIAEMNQKEADDVKSAGLVYAGTLGEAKEVKGLFIHTFQGMKQINYCHGYDVYTGSGFYSSFWACHAGTAIYKISDKEAEAYNRASKLENLND